MNGTIPRWPLVIGTIVTIILVPYVLHLWPMLPHWMRLRSIGIFVLIYLVAAALTVAFGAPLPPCKPEPIKKMPTASYGSLLDDLRHFPSKEDVLKELARHAKHVTWIKARLGLALDPEDKQFWRGWLWECEEDAVPWRLLAQAQDEMVWTCEVAGSNFFWRGTHDWQRETAMQNLREAIGDANYITGVMPPILRPSWRWRVLE